MNSWKKAVLSILSAGFLALTPGLVQGNSCNPCDSNVCSLGCFEFGADFLWWKPCIDDLDFAATRLVNEVFGEETNNVEYTDICPDWEPGFRVYIGFPNLYCNLGFRATYTYLESDEDSSVSSNDGDLIVVSPLLHPHLANNVGFFSLARGHWDSRYQEGALLFTYSISCNECHRFIPFFGAAGIFFEQKLEVDLSDPGIVFEGAEGEVKWESDYWGAGLRLGSDYEYMFNKCLRFFAHAEATLLAGEADNKNRQFVIEPGESDFTTRIEVDDDQCCQFVPGYHLGVGFIYDANFCGCGFVLRLGYEFVVWHNIPNHRVFSGDDNDGQVSNSSSPSTRTLGFQGAFVGLGLNF